MWKMADFTVTMEIARSTISGSAQCVCDIYIQVRSSTHKYRLIKKQQLSLPETHEQIGQYSRISTYIYVFD